jgi:hypothetical protein
MLKHSISCDLPSVTCMSSSESSPFSISIANSVMCRDGLIARPPGPGVARLFFLSFPGILCHPICRPSVIGEQILIKVAWEYTSQGIVATLCTSRPRCARAYQREYVKGDRLAGSVFGKGYLCLLRQASLNNHFKIPRLGSPSQAGLDQSYRSESFRHPNCSP